MDNKILLSDLAEKLASQSNISKRKAESFLRTFFSLIEQNMLNDRFVKIKDFGTFKLVDVSDRESVNVATGERIQIEGHSKISFTAEGKLRDLVNRPFSHFSNIELEESTQIEEINAVDKSYEEHHTLSDSVETKDSDAENEAVATPAIAALAATETAVPTAPASPAPAQPTHEESLLQPQPAPTTAAQPTEHTTQEITQALLKIMQTPQGTQLSPEAIASALQEMLQMPSTASQQPVTGNDEANSEEASTKPQKRRDRRRARFEGKRRPATTVQEETAAAPNADTASLTIATPQEQMPSDHTGIDEVVADTSHISETPVENHNDDDKKEEKTSHCWKIVLAVGVGLAILAGIFYFFHFNECKKDIHNNPHGVEELKSSNTALVPDTMSTENVNASEDSLAITKEKDIKQLPGGKYEIVGKYTIHKIREGETMKIIAIKYFGNPDLFEYIAFYNDVIQSDLIETGDTLKIPALREHGSEDLINK